MNSKIKTASGFLLIVTVITLILLIPLLPVKMDRAIDIATINNVESDYALLYFGYPGCDSACPITLSVFNQVYSNYPKDSLGKSLAVLFVDLLPNSSWEKADQYAKSFNPEFTALALTSEEMSTATLQFGLKFGEPDIDGQLNHKGYTYLLHKQAGVWKIRLVFTDGPPEAAELIDHLKALDL